jgi:DNA-binding CsgD family transcriptional regulator
MNDSKVNIRDECKMKAQSKDFSKRERDVVGLLLQGKSNKQIAFALDIAETTVEFHLRNVYAKLQVSSRAEAILKLGKSTSLVADNQGETIVESEKKIPHTSGKLISEKHESVPLKGSVSTIRKDIEMKNRLFSRFVTGLLFGALFLFYFEVVDRLMNTWHINEKNPLAVWTFISIEFLLVFGVWLIPTVYPARSEFRHSKKISLSVIAVIVMWASAVLGYYLTYTVLLAFVGLPNMEYYLVFGQHSPGFWQAWMALFPRLILFKFLQWTMAGIIVGGFAGLITSSLYAFWVRKTNTRLLYD